MADITFPELDPVLSAGLGTTADYASSRSPSSEDNARAARRHMYQRFLASKDYALPKVDRNFRLERPLQRGWLLPYLLRLDTQLWGRWDYWAEMKESGKLAAGPIPQIEWAHTGESCTGIGYKALTHALEHITPSGHWHSWGTWSNFAYFLDWLLFGFGHPGQMEEPPEPSDAEGASQRLYQAFDLGPLMVNPGDYLGNILAENAHGRNLGFYPTPMSVTTMMVAMLMGAGDHRTETVCDPCVGTGRMLLAASNHSLRLYAQDINPIVIKVTLVNGYMYAPWLVKPLDFLDRMDAAYNAPACAERFSDQLALVAATDPKAAAYTNWSETEHDSDLQPVVHPIKIRRKKGTKSPLIQYELNLT